MTVLLSVDRLALFGEGLTRNTQSRPLCCVSRVAFRDLALNEGKRPPISAHILSVVEITAHCN